MELALSLGDTDKPKSFSFLDHRQQKILGTDLGFCMALDKVCSHGENLNGINKETGLSEDQRRTASSSDPPVQLDLLPFSPVHRSHEPNKFPSFPWRNDYSMAAEPGRGLEVNRRAEEAEDGAAVSSPNSTGKRSDFEGIYTANNTDEREADRRASSRGSDEEENGAMARRKLRLSKEQSAFLEESFKEHHTLNPKQKVALAKQLNLRPRQVEVWFQNRRARTKLKQTEVDCEYLKRCCETLTEENKRLHKELQELRALKVSSPFYMQLPPTTLTMCPSCERVVATTTAGSGGATALASTTTTTAAAANSLTELFSLSTSNGQKATSS
ncbi:Transcription factor HEX [Handroanthus impetiginosus]|uniref:Transcription factor HEX n=1 Tax=Handroanthus impetiginosus TaxID=429701 RepID=A0A2G9GRH0_9LAMI|nr:Transcription factor HEX [Handroanthus impetiginosus]